MTTEGTNHDCTASRSTAGLCNEIPYAVEEYSSDQWWFGELEKIWNLPIGDSVTHDMRRAAHIALNLMLAVEAGRKVHNA